MRSQGSWLVPFTRDLVKQFLALAHQTHLQLQQQKVYDSTYPFEEPAKVLQRLFNSVISDRTGTKVTLGYFLGNQLFRCYFKMNNHRMCKMVFDTLAKSSITVSSLGKADRVTFEYYQARYELHNFHFRQARELLLRCLDTCHANAVQQKRYLLDLRVLLT